MDLGDRSGVAAGFWGRKQAQQADFCFLRIGCDSMYDLKTNEFDMLPWSYLAKDLRISCCVPSQDHNLAEEGY